MKGNLFTLTLIYFVYNASADWKDDLVNQHISCMQNYIEEEKRMVESTQQIQGKGLSCVIIANNQLKYIMDPYRLKIRKCVNDNVEEEDAKHCCNQEQYITGGTVANIANEAINCIYSSPSMSLPTYNPNFPMFK